ncbi:MAG: Eco57I restriction-modification methylase domain-containing protein [Pseudomonadota bacterium]
MTNDALILKGSLFTQDFLTEAIRKTPEYESIDAAALEPLKTRLASILADFPIVACPNESQTEDDLIWPVLAELGWTASLRQQNLAAKGRDDVPDGLLFADEDAKTRANAFSEEWKRYGLGLAIVESKRWARPLDRRSGNRGELSAPSTQMLRYLRRVEDLSTGALRWGVLTNGQGWRLYYQGARSVSEQFLELDLPAILGVPGHDGGLLALSLDARDHWLRVFWLMFGRDAFLPSPADRRTFHQRALEEGRFYEERVARNISDLVFSRVFPELVSAIAAAAPEADFSEVRDGALILLYRLLFLLYAEDRDLLPVRDKRYDDYGLRDKVRAEIGTRKDRNDAFSAAQARYWSVIDDLCRALDGGDASIGLPPYNGGLFDAQRTPILTRVRIPDAVMAEVIDALSFEVIEGRRKYINYRDLSVQQLGSIYERLLEFEVTRDSDGAIAVRPNIFARKSSGSYYTPDELVDLILRETLEPLITERLTAFHARAGQLATDKRPAENRLSVLQRLDPAEALLTLRICDPAMGSGHFLVSLVDYLADQVIAAMAEAEAAVDWADYVSPLAQRIDAIRATILHNAEDKGWTIDPEQLDDRHIIRRMVLKRCVYGVDKNAMAVELAKVSLWLHTFTVGAPLSFLDHHLRHGNSLFGGWVRAAMDRLAARGALLSHDSLQKAKSAATTMHMIEGLTDAEIAEAHRSAEMFAGVEAMTAPLNAFLSLIHALDWLALKDKADRAAVNAWLDNQYGDPVEVARGALALPPDAPFAAILARAKALIEEEAFFNWQAAFPGVWSNWESAELVGGFDAIVGNPPWDRIKLQEVEWFAARRREIALAQRASERKGMIAALKKAGDPLYADYEKAAARAEATARMARGGGDYPLLSSGDINLYALFVERAMALVKPEGMVGLLTPSGVASDKTASTFFQGIATTGRLKALYDFENRRTRFGETPFFPDVDSRFKFCAFVAGGKSRRIDEARCAFFLQDVAEIADPDRCFPLTAADFARVNPNTGTAPIFRTRRDAELTAAIYRRLPVLVDRSGEAEVKAWPVKYATMFHMTNDSGLFRTRAELEEQEGAWPVGDNRWQSKQGEWLPLYEGKMVQAFDHRAASVVVNPENQHRPAQPEPATLEQHADPAWLPDPQFWVRAEDIALKGKWRLGIKHVTAATNVRSMIAGVIPESGAGNSLPIIDLDADALTAPFLLGNLNSIPFDFVLRQKVQGQNLNWYIVEQLPIVPLAAYDAVRFGPKTAGEIVRAAVLELTYTAHDMAPFARDMGHVDEAGAVKPPFGWDEDRRLRLRAKLDAVYFHLYGVTDRDDVRYIYSTFPIVEREETARHGRYLSRDLCLAYVNALAAGQPDAAITL